MINDLVKENERVDDLQNGYSVSYTHLTLPTT